VDGIELAGSPRFAAALRLAVPAARPATIAATLATVASAARTCLVFAGRDRPGGAKHRHGRPGVGAPLL
jgi:hypothetical protein